MYTKIFSGGVMGVDGYIVGIEVNVSNGLTKFELVGLVDQAVSEARERVIASIQNNEYLFPTRRVVVNLAPADIRKSGSFYDLPIALGILLSTFQVEESIDLRQTAVFGELSLSGKIDKVKGLFPMLLAAKDAGIKNVIVPKKNEAEANLVKGLTIYPVSNLKEAAEAISKKVGAIEATGLSPNNAYESSVIDFSDVKGQEIVKRAATVAAAGNHNFMMIGPPGCGKTLIARRMVDILPSLTFSESLEVTKIYSTMGLLNKDALVRSRPFRAPHHTASYASIVGGGRVPRPGEVTLAHNGVLFLDEFPEFEKGVLQTLRQPLEDRCVTVSRAHASVRFPSNFMLVAAMNPCECGYYGDSKKECRCSETSVKRYMGKISGPIMDRIDIVCEMRRLDFDQLSKDSPSKSSAQIREEVQKCRNRQTERYKGIKGLLNNSMMSPSQVREFCPLPSSCESIMKMAVEKLGITARSYDKILRMSRTIADLADRDNIEESDIYEALQYRSFERAS